MTRLTEEESREELFNVLDLAFRRYDIEVQQWLDRNRTGRYVAIENPGSRVEPTEWVWPVRGYAPGSEPTMVEAQQLLDEMARVLRVALEQSSFVFDASPQAYDSASDLYMVEYFAYVPRQDIGQ